MMSSTRYLPLASHVNLISFAITKTYLFKYIENFTTKNWKFSDPNFDIFHNSAQNIDLSPRRI